MVKPRRELILGAFLLSALAVTLQLVAIGTEQWVVAEARTPSGNNQPSTVKYGLFKGVFKYNVGYEMAFEIEITCRTEDNICAYLCGYSAESRENILEKLYNNERVEQTPDCPQVAKSYATRYFRPRVNNNLYREGGQGAYQFIDSGLYISSVIFFVISAGFGLISAVLALWNTVANPINHFFSVFGMHIYHAIAVCSIIIAIALYGALFGGTLAKNVCIQTTIIGDMTSDGFASLGYSYWINIVSLVLYVVSDVLLYVRNDLINREPRQITIDEVQDPGLILF